MTVKRKHLVRLPGAKVMAPPESSRRASSPLRSVRGDDAYSFRKIPTGVCSAPWPSGLSFSACRTSSGSTPRE